MIRSVIIVLALALSLTAAAQQPVKWKHGIVVSKADAGFFFMAKEKGFWAKRGLEVEFIELRGDKHVARALLASELDTAESSPAGVLNAIEHGGDIRFIGSTMPGLPFALYVRKDIKDWQDLKGKTFGVSAPGAIPEVLARLMLQRKGVDASTIKLANAGGSAGRIQALAGGKIDATASATDFVPQVDKLGIKVLGYAVDIVPEYPRFILTARADTLAKKREQAINFIAGYLEGLNYALAHRDETLALTGKINGRPATDPTFVHMYDEVKAKGYIAPDGEIPRAKIEWLQNEMLKLGDLKKKIDLEKYIDDTVRREALKRVSLAVLPK